MAILLGSHPLADLGSAGARYLRADLQVHTPLDPRFTPKHDLSDASARAALAHEYLAAARARGIDLVGITEHNDVSWIEELRYAAKGLDMHLLPGFEVESAEGLHVLCLFDPNESVGHLEDCLARLGLTKDRRRVGKRLELRADVHFVELISLVQDQCRGICIAAHMESDKGLLRAMQGGARADYWTSPGLLAGQISRPPDQVSAWLRALLRDEDPAYRRGRSFAPLLTSDARSLEAIGTQSTWIKLDRVGVEGLRQAFLDPESRLAYVDPFDRSRGGRLLGISWEGGFLDGLRFALNSELNCLIGGRGAGKSTVIESVRFAFGMEPEIKDVRTSVTTLRESALRSGTKVSILIETGPPSPARYLVERTAPHPPLVRDELGEILPDVAPRRLLSPSIYGQKEIYGVAQDARARLALVDSFAGGGLDDVRSREKSVLRELEQHAKLIKDRITQRDEADTALAELPALEEWRRRFREAGFEEKLRERRQLDREEHLLSQAEESLNERARALGRVRAEEPGSPGVAGEGLPNDDLLARVDALSGRVGAEWEMGLENLSRIVAEAQRELDTIRDEWRQRRAARTAAFEAALRELQRKMPDVDPERYLDVERRIERLTPLKSARVQVAKEIEAARAARQALLVELDEVRGAKHRARLAAAERLTAATGGNVRIDLRFQGDRDDLVQKLAALKTGARTDALRRMVNHTTFSPRGFSALVRDRDLQGHFDLPDGQANSLERQLDDATLLEFEVLELCDSVSVELDVGLQSRDYRPLENLSPGQKSTAILLLIMQASREPLLIDQPEDDLDNRFVYDDVVQRLRVAKAERQFLIATHNANIPVLGDAEQILVLEAGEEPGLPMRGRLVANGAIDDDEVRTAAELILEGGEDAFSRRREKYGW